MAYLCVDKDPSWLGKLFSFIGPSYLVTSESEILCYILILVIH